VCCLEDLEAVIVIGGIKVRKTIKRTVSGGGGEQQDKPGSVGGCYKGSRSHVCSGKLVPAGKKIAFLSQIYHLKIR